MSNGFFLVDHRDRKPPKCIKLGLEAESPNPVPGSVGGGKMTGLMHQRAAIYVQHCIIGTGERPSGEVRTYEWQKEKGTKTERLLQSKSGLNGQP